VHTLAAPGSSADGLLVGQHGNREDSPRASSLIPIGCRRIGINARILQMRASPNLSDLEAVFAQSANALASRKRHSPTVRDYTARTLVALSEVSGTLASSTSYG
jgi:hypothetical protein